MAHSEAVGVRRRRSMPLEPLLVRPEQAFRLLGVGRTLGYELMRAGHLERVQIGRRAVAVTLTSVKRLAAGGLTPPLRRRPAPGDG